MTIQTIPSVISEVNEDDPLLPNSKDTPLTISCNTCFDESPLLLMKLSSYDNVSDDICDLTRSVH